ncbi:SMI1/KNR4 family protein [Actinobacillus equuli]|uniref:SMI1/KNR4 family protein n=1 Tax=Actinobacillus equuli TaxID=718 RepID=UPI00244673AF|nr:SMI1/KNR4 family protein [Actinobacillus equuli]WGE82650.1 SMI1/KNR4 family protein [Actinobacillus equuli subsp. equuli]
MKFRDLEIRYDSGTADIKIIKGVEDIFNIKFPKLYIELMSKHNGLAVEPNCITYYDSYNDEEGMAAIGFDSFETELNPEPQDIRRQYIYDDPVYGYEHVYSFGRTAGGDFICFDYRDESTGDEPKICIVIHDEYDEETGKHLLFPVADNFEEFLDGLKTFDEIMAKYEE